MSLCSGTTSKYNGYYLTGRGFFRNSDAETRRRENLRKLPVSPHPRVLAATYCLIDKQSVKKSPILVKAQIQLIHEVVEIVMIVHHLFEQPVEMAFDADQHQFFVR